MGTRYTGYVGCVPQRCLGSNYNFPCKMRDQTLANKINAILSEWDPIGVEKPISEDEYRQYVPEIIKAIDSEVNLEKSLIRILDQIGIDYDINNHIFQEDIKSVIGKIFPEK